MIVEDTNNISTTMRLSLTKKQSSSNKGLGKWLTKQNSTITIESKKGDSKEDLDSTMPYSSDSDESNVNPAASRDGASSLSSISQAASFGDEVSFNTTIISELEVL